MTSNIQITATAVTVTVLNADGSQASQQTFPAGTTAAGTFTWAYPVPNPQSPGTNCSLLVVILPDGGAQAAALTA